MQMSLFGGVFLRLMADGTPVPADEPRFSRAGPKSLHAAAAASTAAASPAPASAPMPSPATPTAPATNAASPTADPPPVNRGCAGCTTEPRADLRFGLLGAALAAAVTGARRRRR